LGHSEAQEPVNSSTVAEDFFLFLFVTQKKEIFSAFFPYPRNRQLNREKDDQPVDFRLIPSVLLEIIHAEGF